MARIKKKIPKDIKHFWNFKHEIYEIDGIVFKNQSIIIPTSLRNEMLNIIHDGHLGIEKCKNRARGLLYWPKINQDIENLIENCLVCQQLQNSNKKQTLIPHEMPKLPYEKLGSDIFEWNKELYILIVDYFSKYIEISKISSTSAGNVISVLKSTFARHGIPKLLISDNGPPFNSKEFKKFMYDWGVEHRTSSPYYPQSNGLAERSIQTVKKMLTKCLLSNTDPYLGLLSLRTSKHLGYSPSQLLMSRNLRTRIPVTQEILQPTVVDVQEYKQNVLDYQGKMKAKYDRNATTRSPLRQNTPIFFKKLPTDKSWKRGKVVENVSEPRSVIVEDREGNKYRRNEINTRVDTTKQLANISKPIDTNKQLTLRSGKRITKN